MVFGFKKIKSIIVTANDVLAKLNVTLHGTVESAQRTTTNIRAAGSGAMAARGITDCIVAYQCNDILCLSVSAIGTAADVGGMICGNIPGVKGAVPYVVGVSTACKGIVHLCRTGNITFACKDKI